MRTAIGLIVLGTAGGIVPVGIEGLAHAAPVLAGAAIALGALVGFCLAPVLWRRNEAAPRSEVKALSFSGSRSPRVVRTSSRGI